MSRRGVVPSEAQARLELVVQVGGLAHGARGVRELPHVACDRDRALDSFERLVDQLLRAGQEARRGLTLGVLADLIAQRVPSSCRLRRLLRTYAIGVLIS